MIADTPSWLWLTFAGTLATLLAIDLFVHRGDRGASRRSAAIWTVVWIATGLAFGLLVWAVLGGRAAQDYLAAYAIEKTLSVDNLFVFLLIFSSLNIPPNKQGTVLLWGIFGALVFRGAAIFAGAAAVERWDWTSYVFGGLLALAAVRTFREDPTENRESRMVGWLSRHLPMTCDASSGRFLVAGPNGRVATPLLLALVSIELTDILFAIDSVPAAFSVTDHEFLIYSSNAFAILGLRALYTVLASSLRRLAYLHYGLAAVLAFTAAKILLEGWVHIPAALSLAIVVILVATSIAWSVHAERARSIRLARSAP
jgi:tellurite resistance protein TerC